MEKKIGIVTVLYNSTTVLEGFFESLGKQTYKNFVLYAIDNVSPDDSQEKTRRLAKDAWFETVVLPQTDNGGVAKGNNVGIRKALEDGCDYVLLANNDIEFEPDTIRILADSMEKNHAQMIVPKLYYYGTDRLWFGGGRFGFTKPTWHTGLKEKDAPQYNVAGCIEYASTCFMIIDKAVFDKIGIMDEKYFAYYDDTDFVWRAVKNAGMKLYYEPAALVQHKVGVSTRGKLKSFAFYLDTRNLAYFANKYFPWHRRWIFYTFKMLRYLPSNLRHPSYPKVWKMIPYFIEGANMAKK